MRSAETLSASIIAPAFRDAEGSGGASVYGSQLLLELPHVAEGDAVVAGERHLRLGRPHAIHAAEVQTDEPVAAPLVEGEGADVIVRRYQVNVANAPPPQLLLGRVHQAGANAAALLE